MRELRDILDTWLSRRDESFVLGTVVDVAGSSYRKPGARMLVGRDGSRVGLISGGCLERDVVRQAFEWTEDGPRTVVFDMRSDELNPEGPYGTGCEGLVQLLLERVEPGKEEPLATLVAGLEEREPTVQATIFADEDDGALVGSRFFTGDGSSGADLSEPVEGELRAVMDEASNWARPKTVLLEGGGAELKALVEPIRPPIDLLVFGAGDDVQPVARLGHQMGWDVRIASTRPTLATPERFPNANSLRCEPVGVLLDRIDVHSQSHVLIMTHDLETDAELIPPMLDSDAPFVGLLGPRSRTKKVLQRLQSKGRLPEPGQLERLQTPLGLDLGGEAPSEVALSIVSAVLAAHRGGSGEVLQDREQRIHPSHERLERTAESNE